MNELLGNLGFVKLLVTYQIYRINLGSMCLDVLPSLRHADVNHESLELDTLKKRFYHFAVYLLEFMTLLE
jgi:hypothetical protein